MANLFENYETLPKKVLSIITKLNEDCDYSDLEKALSKLKSLGFTFEYYLDAVPYNLVAISFFKQIETALKEGKIKPPIDCPEDDDLTSLINGILLQEYYEFNGVEHEITLNMLLGNEKIF